MPEGEGWRRFRQVIKVIDRIILVCLIAFGVMMILGIGFCLVQYARM